MVVTSEALAAGRISVQGKLDRESLIRTASGSEFQSDGADNRKVRIWKSLNSNKTRGMCTLWKCRSTPSLPGITFRVTCSV